MWPKQRGSETARTNRGVVKNERPFPPNFRGRNIQCTAMVAPEFWTAIYIHWLLKWATHSTYRRAQVNLFIRIRRRSGSQVQDGELQLPQPAAVRHGGPGQGSGGGDKPACGWQLRGAPGGGEPEPAGHRPAEEEVWGDGGRAEEDQDESQEERWAGMHENFTCCPEEGSALKTRCVCCTSSSVFYPPAAERFSPLVKVVLNRERQSTGWDRQVDAKDQNQPQQVWQPQNIIWILINQLII